MGLALWSRTATEVGTPPQSRGPHLPSARSPPQAGKASSCGTGASWSLRWGRLSPRVTDFDLTSLLLQVWICSHLTHPSAAGNSRARGSGGRGGVPRGGSHARGGEQEGGGSPGDLRSSQATSRGSLIISSDYSERTDGRSRDGAHVGPCLGICGVVCPALRGCSRAGTARETRVPAAATSVLRTVACGPEAAPELGPGPSGAPAPAGHGSSLPRGSTDSFSSVTGTRVTQWELGWGPRPPTGHQPSWGAEPGLPAPPVDTDPHGLSLCAPVLAPRLSPRGVSEPGPTCQQV